MPERSFALVRCPEIIRIGDEAEVCEQLAVASPNRSFASTHGPVAHARVHCLARHALMMPVSGLRVVEMTSEPTPLKPLAMVDCMFPVYEVGDEMPIQPCFSPAEVSLVQPGERTPLRAPADYRIHCLLGRHTLWVTSADVSLKGTGLYRPEA